MYLGLEQKDRERTAAVDIAGRRVSYGDVQDFIRYFQAEHTHGRHMTMILCHNDVPSLLAYLACMASRVVPLMLSPKTDAGHIRKLVETYRPESIMGCREELEAIGLSFDEVKECVPGTGFSLALTGLSGYPLYGELSLLLTTSGSTGSPKLVRHSYRNLEEQAKNIAAFFALDGTERPMVALPMMYTMGLSMINSHLHAGSAMLLTEESLLSKPFWEFFRRERATSFTGVPYSFELLHRVRMTRMDLPDLDLLTQGGGKLAPELQKEFAGYMQEKNGRYIATYGQTEGSARMAFLPPAYALTKIGSIGKAIPNGKLYLKDAQGKLIETPGTEGEMYYEGPNVTLGYAERGEDLRLGDQRHGVLATGDLAYFDEDGMFYITGRIKRFLKLFGHRVGLDECERILKEELGAECACAGTDQKLTVFMTDAGMKEQAREVLVKKTELYPYAIEVKVLQELPRSAAGKVLYSELNAML